jgi:hypothetical protein
LKIFHFCLLTTYKNFLRQIPNEFPFLWFEAVSRLGSPDRNETAEKIIISSDLRKYEVHKNLCFWIPQTLLIGLVKSSTSNFTNYIDKKTSHGRTLGMKTSITFDDLSKVYQLMSKTMSLENAIWLLPSLIKIESWIFVSLF